MDLSRLSDVRLAMQLAGIRPQKGLGQHFLIDKDSLEMIVAAAGVTKNDTVLEIGPGLGVMTGVLAEDAKEVVAVEADPNLADLLGKTAPANLRVERQDIMQFNVGTLPPGYKVVANLPYYITSKILRLLLESPNPPAVMSILIQKEVAERVVAAPGRLSILALSVQYYAEAELVGVVERHKFWPAPNVDSAVLKITRREHPVFDADPDKLFRLIKAGFGEKRKQLKNALAGGLNCTVGAAEALLAKSGLNPTARAQELSLGEWERLYRAAVSGNLLD